MQDAAGILHAMGLPEHVRCGMSDAVAVVHFFASRPVTWAETHAQPYNLES